MPAVLKTTSKEQTEVQPGAQAFPLSFCSAVRNSCSSVFAFRYQSLDGIEAQLVHFSPLV